MNIVEIILIVIEIFFFSIVVSLDNAILIGLLTKDMDENKRKKAAFFGAMLGVFLRLILAFIFYFILVNDIKVIYIIGGVFVAIAGLLVINEKEGAKEDKNIDASLSIFKVVLSIFLVDAMLSFDNSIAIADQTTHVTNHISDNKNLYASLIIIGSTLISFPIVYFGSTSLGSILSESKFLVYVSAYLLIAVGIGMFIEDPIFNEAITNLRIWWRLLIQYGGAALMVLSSEGINHLIKKNKLNKENK